MRSIKRYNISLYTVQGGKTNKEFYSIEARTKEDARREIAERHRDIEAHINYINETITANSEII